MKMSGRPAKNKPLKTKGTDMMIDTKERDGKGATTAPIVSGELAFKRIAFDPKSKLQVVEFFIDATACRLKLKASDLLSYARFQAACLDHAGILARCTTLECRRAGSDAQQDWLDAIQRATVAGGKS